MGRTKFSSRGFTLIASLMLLLLMSGLALGLLMMVNTESRVGANDMQSTRAYHAAEGAMEKMGSDMTNMYRSILAPDPTQITGLSALVPTNDPYIQYKDYSLSPHLKADGTLDQRYGKISGGAYKDLYASILQVDLKATADIIGPHDQVSMMRTVEVALVPVFQFGVFSDSDLGFFSSPDLDFQGRVHTNGDLYLGVANSYVLTFHDKVTAYGEVIRTQLPNTLPANANNDTGTVRILKASQGCDGTSPPSSTCRAIAQSEGSVVGGPGSAYNSGPPSWFNISTSTYNGWIINGNWGGPNGTGVSRLSLPFVGGNAQPYEIVRRPPAGEAPTSAIGASRLYNQAQIRVLLADDPNELPGLAGDPDNVRLANGQYNASPDYTNGFPVPIAGGANDRTFFAEASAATPNPSGWVSGTTACLNPDWGIFAAGGPVIVPSIAHSTLLPAGAPVLSSQAGASTCMVDPANPPSQNKNNRWNLIDGYLRVEVLRQNAGGWQPVTREWLALGFARGLNPPTAPQTNPVHPNAILLLEEPADRDGDGGLDPAAPCKPKAGGGCIGIARPAEVANDPNTGTPYYNNGDGNTTTKTNWYPINFYDAREGEVRDTVQAGCTPNGVMNAVELDVGNLALWLNGTIGGTGRTVEQQAQNGYVLYFSDRRGMRPNPNGTGVAPANTKSGDSGLEDSINTNTATGTPNGALENPAPGKTFSPEDVNLNARLDNWGGVNVGDGFNVNTATANPDPYGLAAGRIANCYNIGAKNRVSGARHVLKLVDGGMSAAVVSYLPRRWDTGKGGFTVGSENPVYIQGNYNSSVNDPTWANPNTTEPTHAAAGIVADAVTVLSSVWSDKASLINPTGATGNRNAADTYYRVAIAAGKNINFPNPPFSGSGSITYGFGTDGGLHNFLRFLEDWTNDDLYYKGSLVSLYYSTYATGTFKCCNDAVYHPPSRHYVFDPLFAQYQNLPPGTPLFRDVENLSYRQDFSPRKDCY